MERLEKLAQIALEEDNPDQSLAYCDTLKNLAAANALEKTSSYARVSLISGQAYFEKANYPEAEKWLLQAVRVFEAAGNTDDQHYVKSLYFLGLVYSDLGKLEDAESYLNKALLVYEKGAGKSTLDYAECLNNLAHVYFDKGDYTAAESGYLETLTIRENLVGKQSVAYAGSLVNLGMLQWKLGHFEKSEQYYLEARSILENQDPEEAYAFYKNCLSNLSILYSGIERYEDAEILQQTVLDLDEKKHGKLHPSYARGLNNLGVLYYRMGQYEKTEKLFKEALNIRKNSLGTESLAYASSMHNLATIQNLIGDYDKAEKGFVEAISIRKKVLGPGHPDYGSSLSGLAVFYTNLGNYEKADTLYKEILSLFRETLGEYHPDYISVLKNYAGVNFATGQYDRAASDYQKVLETTKKIQGEEDPSYADGLHFLAKVYHVKGDLPTAEFHYLGAEAILKLYENKLPNEYAEIQHSLGEYYFDAKSFDKAEKRFTLSAELREKILGPNSMDYGQSIQGLAGVKEATGQIADTERLLEKASAIKKGSLSRAQSFLSQKELTNYAATFQTDGDQLGRFIFLRYHKGVDHRILTGQLFNYALYYKGFILTSVARLNNMPSNSEEGKMIHLKLKGYSRRLASAYARPVGNQQGIQELEEKVNQVEKELIRLISGYSEATKDVMWEEVKAQLKASEAAIEFVHFRLKNPTQKDSILYAALLLKPDAQQPQFIPLFEEKELDHLLNADKERKADYVNELYAWANRGMVQLGSAKKSLYDLIWSKINEAGLEGIETIYYSPSGVLHRLNLGAIAINDEAILSDRYNLVALNSTRQLVIPSAVNTPANDALLVGGVNFEVETTLPELDDQPLLASRSASEVQASSGTRGGSWSYLKWTEKEVERIVATIAPEGYQVDTLYGSNAEEETIKAIGLGKSSPRVLHIATHGFFFPDPEVKKQEIGLDGAEPVFKSSDNPMIRSGLILAGGNYAWQHGQALNPDQEDGILTAYEISQMNLTNTELVVLSACETGLGDIQGNEGVYGLQRAFKIAGAKYLIMSLWQVPDRETMEFMTTFYRNWLEEEMTIPDAFRKTQREMRDRFFNPYSWAGFVLVE
jgi:tetratricopeptide (TPR) repeat protein